MVQADHSRKFLHFLRAQPRKRIGVGVIHLRLRSNRIRMNQRRQPWIPVQHLFAVGRAGYKAEQRLPESLLEPFERGEDEGTIFRKRTSKCCPVLIETEWWLRRGKGVASIENIVPQKVEDFAVKR